MTDHDNPYPDGSPVLTRYPRRGMTPDVPRESWPWLHGVVEQRCGPDEWLITIYGDRDLAETADGRPAPDGTPDEQLWWPQCFRTSCEILRADYRTAAHLYQAERELGGTA